MTDITEKQANQYAVDKLNAIFKEFNAFIYLKAFLKIKANRKLKEEEDIINFSKKEETYKVQIYALKLNDYNNFKLVEKTLDIDQVHDIVAQYLLFKNPTPAIGLVKSIWYGDNL